MDLSNLLLFCDSNARPARRMTAMSCRVRSVAVLAAITLVSAVTVAQQRPAPEIATVLRPARVFDGETLHEGWAVRVRGNRIEAAGPAAAVATSGASTVDLAGLTLL